MEPFSLAIEGASLVVALIPLVIDLSKSLRNHSKYESVEKIVKTQKDLLEKIYWHTRPQDWERVIMLLDVSDIIMPLVVERIKRRFVLLLVIAAPIGVFFASTFRPQAGFTPINVVGVLLLLSNMMLPILRWQAQFPNWLERLLNWPTRFLNWLAGFLNWPKRLLRFLQEYLFNTDERNFLENVSLLHDEFYDYSVREAVKDFNKACDDALHIQGQKAKRAEVINSLKAAFKGYLSSEAGPQ